MRRTRGNRNVLKSLISWGQKPSGIGRMYYITPPPQDNPGVERAPGLMKSRTRTRYESHGAKTID